MKNKKEFKVLFIIPDFNYVKEAMSDYRGSISMGVAYISSMLKKNGFKTSLIHLTSHLEKRNFVDRVLEENPDLIAFSFFTHQRDDVELYISYIRDYGIKTPIIIGGVHPTTNPEDSIKIKGVDYICVGEGEYPMVDLCNRMIDGKDTTRIKNIWARKGSRIIRNDVRPLLQNLDKLPFPDRSIFDYENVSDSKERVFPVFVTRGCPYRCTYCCNHVYQRIYQGKGPYVRYRNPEFVIKEIKEGISNYPWVKYIRLVDDAFCLNRKNVEKFCKLLKKEVGLPFLANTRVNLIDENLARTLSEGGCIGVYIGIESGNPYLREKVLNRFMTNDQIMKAVEFLHKNHIRVVTYNIIGLPTETLENALETVKLNAYSRSDSYHVSIFQPYPNTDLYDYCKKNGMLTDGKVSTFFGDYKINQSSITKKEVMFAYKYFYIYVKLYRLLGKVKFFEKILDRMFLSRSTHRIQIIFYPVTFFLTNPVLSIYRGMLKVAPRTTRKIVGMVNKK